MHGDIDESMPSISITDIFAMPHDETMSFNEFVELLSQSKTENESSINYIQVNIDNEMIIEKY